jgi:two-component system sensor histidine kinase DesK
MTVRPPSAPAAAPYAGRGRRRVPTEGYVHLVWLVFLGFQPLFDPTADAWDVVYVVGILILFFPVYFWTWSRRGGSSLPGIAVLGLMGAVLPAVNSGATTFLVYAAAAAGTKLEPRRAIAVLAVLVGMAFASAVASQVPWPVVAAVYTPAVLLTPIIGAVTMADRARSRANAHLHRAHDEIERLAAIAERERIARDLHDLLGHTLSVIVLKSELASKLADHDPARAATEIRDVERISRRALGEVREAVVRYRQRGLAAELEEARAAFDAAAVALGVALPDAPPPPRVEGMLAMVVREALTNVLRHARATHCDVRVARDGDAWVLEVRDDGHGRLGPDGNGLTGVRERVEALGGRVELRGGAGVHLTVRLPAGAVA